MKYISHITMILTALCAVLLLSAVGVGLNISHAAAAKMQDLEEEETNEVAESTETNEDEENMAEEDEAEATENSVDEVTEITNDTMMENSTEVKAEEVNAQANTSQTQEEQCDNQSNASAVSHGCFAMLTHGVHDVYAFGIAVFHWLGNHLPHPHFGHFGSRDGSQVNAIAQVPPISVRIDTERDELAEELLAEVLGTPIFSTLTADGSYLQGDADTSGTEAFRWREAQEAAQRFNNYAIGRFSSMHESPYGRRELLKWAVELYDRTCNQREKYGQRWLSFSIFTNGIFTDRDYLEFKRQFFSANYFETLDYFKRYHDGRHDDYDRDYRDSFSF